MQNNSRTGRTNETDDSNASLSSVFQNVQRIVRSGGRGNVAAQIIRSRNNNQYCQPCREPLSDKTNSAAINR